MSRTNSLLHNSHLISTQYLRYKSTDISDLRNLLVVIVVFILTLIITSRTCNGFVREHLFVYNFLDNVVIKVMIVTSIYVF